MNTPHAPMDFSVLRRTYLNGSEPFFLESGLKTRDPFKLFDQWFREVASIKDLLYEEVNAVSLSTVSADNRPSSRMVLLKSYDDVGFTFYTNYDSRKGNELTANPNAAMLFYWSRMHRQIRVEGTVERLPMEVAEAYWNSRPVASRIGSKASKQSTVIPDRQFLETRKAELEHAVKADGEGAASKPPTWGGFLLRPRYFEFWQGQSDRLHDRLIFSQTPPTSGAEHVHPCDREGWHLYRLSP